PPGGGGVAVGGVVAALLATSSLLPSARRGGNPPPAIMPDNSRGNAHESEQRDRPRASGLHRASLCQRRTGADPGISRSAGQDHRAIRGRGADRRVARLIALKLSEKFGQQFYIENMAGAGGNLGMGARATAPADGYTILFVSSSYTVNPSLYAKPPYDPDKDFVPVTKAAGSPNGLFVNPSIPAKSVKELVELIKANPGKYTFASPGIGTTPHL